MPYVGDGFDRENYDEGLRDGMAVGRGFRALDFWLGVSVGVCIMTIVLFLLDIVKIIIIKY